MMTNLLLVRGAVNPNLPRFGTQIFTASLFSVTFDKLV